MTFFLGILAVSICTVIQCAFVAILQIFLKKWFDLPRIAHSFVRMTALLSAVTTFLLFGMILQVLVWAFLFVIQGEFESMRVAFYFSMVNFTSLGYGDIILSPERWILGPMEAANGILMLGLSTSALFSLLHRLGDHIRTRSAIEASNSDRIDQSDFGKQ